MAIRKIYSDIDVLTAAKQRIRNVFQNDCKIYLNFSSGKDSLCVASIVYDLILNGEIDRKKLKVLFIDEEGLYPSMVDAAMRWRKKFMKIGVPFEWFCLPVKQVNVVDSLSATESWITWETAKKDVWMRDMPPFAIHTSPILHYEGEMNYQTFLDKYCADGIKLIGLRASESVQRLKNLSTLKMDRIPSSHGFFPIYDWTDADVWLYIKEHNLEFPEIYMHLYEAGVNKRNLRLCCFFGDSSTQGLRWVSETDPQLWERIQRRQPNAYLALLYWDSEMFHRQSNKRTKLEENEEQQDYKALVFDMLFQNTAKYNIPSDTLKKIGSWKRFVIERSEYMTQKEYKVAYETIRSGDPKARGLRALMVQVGAKVHSMGGVEVNE